MISKQNASISALLACLALVAILSGLWMTRPADMDLGESIVVVAVIYTIVAGGPQVLIFAAVVSSMRQGRLPVFAWWTAAYLVFLLQFGAGAILVAGASASEERLFTVAAAVLVVAALVAVASGLAVSRVACKQSEATAGS